jgi:hypothetical protein
MQPLPPFPQHLICVSSEQDVITMRQEVRQVARSLGLGLIEQAKIATAISAVARVMLGLTKGTQFTMRMAGQGETPALEILCKPKLWQASMSIALLEERLNLTNARLLVDEAHMTQQSGEPVLTLRMRLARLSR